MDEPDLSSLHTLQHDVFVSFSWADDAHARALDGALSERLKTFFAPRDLPPDVQRQARFQFADLLMDHVTRSAHFVGLLSPRYLDSAWCRLEMQGFANLRRADPARRMWLFALESVGDAVPAALRGQVFSGDLPALLAAVSHTVAAGERPFGHDIGMPPRPCLPGLPLRPLYRPPKRAPWGLEAQSRGTPGAPPYAVYESLVREYMVQMLRRGRWGIAAGPDEGTPWLELPFDGLDPRHQRLTRYAHGDAEYLLTRKTDPFSGHKRCSEICIELMLRMGAAGENDDDLRAMAECHSHMGAQSCREALGITQRALAAGADASGYRHIRARAHYLLGEYGAAADVIRAAPDGGHNVVDHLLLAAACAQLGDGQGARQAAAQVSVGDPAFNLAEERLNTRLEIDADIEHWIDGLAKAGLPA